MEKLELHSLKTVPVSQFLSKTYNPRKICKYPSTTDPQCGEASSTYASLNKYCPCMMFEILTIHVFPHPATELGKIHINCV